jgi:hypothetical protein
MESAGMPHWPSDAKGVAQDRITGDELKRLLSPGKPVIIKQNSRRGAEVNLNDGCGNTVLSKTSQATAIGMSGKMFFRDDMWCWRSPSTLMGRPTCSEVYRNPKGSRKSNDELIRLSWSGTYKFSLLPLSQEDYADRAAKARQIARQGRWQPPVPN